VPVVDPVQIVGLRDLTRRLRQVNTDLPKAVRLAANEAAEVVVVAARRDVPKRSGKAAGSIRARSTRTAARVSSGGRRAPYMPWLDYGGKVGKNNTAVRRFIADGRFVYPAFRENREQVAETFRTALDRIIAEAGLEST
jgi:HK97 gp10 family phage protein